MEPLVNIDGLVAPMDRANVDTDAIIPKQYLKSIKKSGFGPTLFDEWRYLDSGEPGQDHSLRPINPEFILNLPRYQGAQILLAKENFGCGSSREHAPWALRDFGFRVIVAPSFADIFYNNSLKNGLLPIVLDSADVDQLFIEVQECDGYRLLIDVAKQELQTPSKQTFTFHLDTFRKHCLLNGLDEIGTTLEHAEDIKNYEMRRMKEAPWLFQDFN